MCIRDSEYTMLDTDTARKTNAALTSLREHTVEERSAINQRLHALHLELLSTPRKQRGSLQSQIDMLEGQIREQMDSGLLGRPQLPVQTMGSGPDGGAVGDEQSSSRACQASVGLGVLSELESQDFHSQDMSAEPLTLQTSSTRSVRRLDTDMAPDSPCSFARRNRRGDAPCDSPDASLIFRRGRRHSQDLTTPTPSRRRTGRCSLSGLTDDLDEILQLRISDKLSREAANCGGTSEGYEDFEC
eukprot:TRINITY_DN1671_c0_g1_i1.p1 TRINITY_DN1671_c0_g1~~TRINITY_DN1671_c0_g1_i1.p1  ORF type:complete len:244 (+),score=6.82 TRINITY_DN1671_c0_g1_i1:135-866(+)